MHSAALPPGLPRSLLPPNLGFPFTVPPIPQQRRRSHARHEAFDADEGDREIDEDEVDDEDEEIDDDDDAASDVEYDGEYEVNDEDDYYEGEGLRRVDLDALNLPRFIYSKGAAIKEPLCVICQEEYQEGDVLLTLSCVHNFHAPCIEKWLACKAQCPLCKEEIISMPPPPQPSSDLPSIFHVH